MDAEREYSYYVVQAKCGHVGKGKYIPLDFPIQAKDEERAVLITQNRPGVKHHSPNDILSIRKINYVEFLLYKEIFHKDPYWKWKTGYSDELTFRIKEEFPRRSNYKQERKEALERRTRHTAREFRLKRLRHIERSICRDVAEEYGLSV